MSAWTLVVGNKNYSSWSLRGYLAVAQTGVPFEEIVIPLSQPDSKDELLRHSPSGLVPVLRHGSVEVWESLAIAEYCAEQFPAAGLWPADAAARALARAVSAEMHAGFAPLRQHMPMNMRASHPGRGRTEASLANIARITKLWRQCRAGHGGGGPFLFGAGFTVADCMFAPVVSRFRTYGVELDEVCAGYAAAVWAHPPLARWFAAACAEPWTIEY